VLLTPIARDTFVVQERGGRRIAFLDLFRIAGNSEKRRVEEGVRQLQTIVKPSIVRTTGVVEVSVATEWQSVSLAIANELLIGVNQFNQRTRQGQAAEERKFVEGRLALAASDLRAAEDRLQDFLKTNRQFTGSPDLTFERDRLGRDVTLKQQVFTSLTQSYEEVRIREVRDTPVITVIETPSVPTLPEPRRRLARVLLGLIVGALFGAFLAFVSGAIARRRQEGDSEANEFVNTLGEVKGKMLGRFRRMRRRSRV
jgi:capsule polysaccharide export protein KpsE/RkpR